jgi:hypothetical protein
VTEHDFIVPKSRIAAHCCALNACRESSDETPKPAAPILLPKSAPLTSNAVRVGTDFMQPIIAYLQFQASVSGPMCKSQYGIKVHMHVRRSEPPDHHKNLPDTPEKPHFSRASRTSRASLAFFFIDFVTISPAATLFSQIVL